MPEAEDVLEAQSAKFAALVARDLETLELLLDDDLTYVHASGGADNKARFLQNVAERGYLGVTCKSTEVRILGDVAVVTGLADIHVTSEVRFDARFTDVWHRREGWRNVAWQSTKVPA